MSAHDAPHPELFALAVTRAANYLQRARVPASHDPEGIARALEGWALRTRFASRINMLELARVLAERPTGHAQWRDGAWQREPMH